MSPEYRCAEYADSSSHDDLKSNFIDKSRITDIFSLQHCMCLGVCVHNIAFYNLPDHI